LTPKHKLVTVTRMNPDQNQTLPNQTAPVQAPASEPIAPPAAMPQPAPAMPQAPPQMPVNPMAMPPAAPAMQPPAAYAQPALAGPLPAQVPSIAPAAAALPAKRFNLSSIVTSLVGIVLVGGGGVVATGHGSSYLQALHISGSHVSSYGLAVPAAGLLALLRGTGFLKGRRPKL
jgi:hypothetical protein